MRENTRYMIAFPLTVLESLMDVVEDMFVAGNDLPAIYRQQVADNPYNRWFAYDVARNHLRVYRRYFDGIRTQFTTRPQSVSGRNPDIRVNLDTFVYLNNIDGPRRALYPDVMEFLSEMDNIYLFTNTRIDTPIPDIVGGETAGIVISGSYPRLDGVEYIDRIDDSIDNYQLQHLIDRAKDLRHLHMDLIDFYHFPDGPTIFAPHLKYLSVTRFLSWKGLEFSDTNLDYLRTDHGLPGLERMIHHNIKYVDVESSIILPGRYPDLMHLGSEPSTDLINSISRRSEDFPQLTSLRATYPRRFEAFPNLIHLSMSRVTSRNRMPMTLRHVRTLDISYHRGVKSRITLGSWNLPQTCTVLSVRVTELSDDHSLTTDINLSDFNDLVALMVPGVPGVIRWLKDQQIPDDLLVGISEPRMTEEMIADYQSMSGEVYFSNVRKGIRNLDADQIRDMLTAPGLITDIQLLRDLTGVYLSIVNS